MPEHICARCGRPARGFASVWRDGKEEWFCHPDEGEDCYSLQAIEKGAES